MKNNDQNNIISIANDFLAAPYLENPLVGSYEKTEELTVNLDAFDCVTFVETVLAFALSKETDDFVRNLIKIRYKDSKITWLDRNHYFSEWIENNKNLGIIKQVESSKAIKLKRKLNYLENYPEKDLEIKLIPVDEIESLAKQSNVIAFATTDENLDFKHLGFVDIDDSGLHLIHASRSLQQVVKEPLKEFLKRYGECPGVTILVCELNNQ